MAALPRRDEFNLNDQKDLVSNTMANIAYDSGFVSGARNRLRRTKAAANDNKKKFIDNNINDYITPKPRNDNEIKDSKSNVIQGKFGKDKQDTGETRDFYQGKHEGAHETVAGGAGANLSKEQQKLFNPAQRFENKSDREKKAEDYANNWEYSNQRNADNDNSDENILNQQILQELIAQDEWERALAFQQVLEAEKVRKEKIRKLKQYGDFIISEFKKEGINISKADTESLIDANFKVKSAWIMTLTALFMDLVDIFVTILNLALIGMSGMFAATVALAPFALIPTGLASAINISFAFVKIIYGFIFMIWVRRFGQTVTTKDKAKKIRKVYSTFLKRFFIARGWTLLLEIIPILEAIPLNTINVRYVVGKWKKVTKRLKGVVV